MEIATGTVAHLSIAHDVLLLVRPSCTRLSVEMTANTVLKVGADLRPAPEALA